MAEPEPFDAQEATRKAKLAALYAYAQYVGQNLASSAERIEYDAEDRAEAIQFLAEVDVHSVLLQRVMEEIRRVG